MVETAQGSLLIDPLTNKNNKFKPREFLIVLYNDGMRMIASGRIRETERGSNKYIAQKTIERYDRKLAELVEDVRIAPQPLTKRKAVNWICEQTL